jgi:hypothetical protein
VQVWVQVWVHFSTRCIMHMMRMPYAHLTGQIDQLLLEGGGLRFGQEGVQRVVEKTDARLVRGCGGAGVGESGVSMYVWTTGNSAPMRIHTLCTVHGKYVQWSTKQGVQNSVRGAKHQASSRVPGDDPWL